MIDNELELDDEQPVTSLDWSHPTNDRRKAREPRRQQTRRDTDWRQRIRDVLMLAMLVTIGLSTVAWVMGPVLGKRIADSTTDEVQAHERRINELDSEKIVTRETMKVLRTDVDALARQNAGSTYLLCEIYRSVQKDGIPPQLCAGAKDVK